MGLTTLQKFVLGLVAFILLIIGWGMFPLFFKWLMIEIGTGKTKLEDFGPLGDIYGSLNTLFTSATLLIVLYSAYLQRQANEDARLAMDKQLQQARNATAAQLREARRSTREQITQARYALRAQLKQAEESTKQQLALAQANHDAQMKETKYSIFSNMFYALLNQMHERFNQIEVKNSKSHLNVTQILLIINDTLFHLIIDEWKDISKIGVTDVQKKYFETTSNITAENDGELGDNLSNLFLYLYSYRNLFELINRSEISEEDKLFFSKIVRESMTIGEQVAMFWIAAFDEGIKDILRNQVIFNFYDERMMPFAVKFLDKNCFSSNDVLNTWHFFEEEQKKTPA